MATRSAMLCAVAVILAAGRPSHAQPGMIIDPGLVSRTYAFSGQTQRASESIFGAYNVIVFGASTATTFDDRDGILQIAYDTEGAGIEAGLIGAGGGYDVRSLTIRWEIDAPVGTPRIDPTNDPAASYPLITRPTPPVADFDAGRPIELFGAGFRNGFIAYTTDPFDPSGPPLFGPPTPPDGMGNFYAEGYSFADPTLPETRHVFPIDFDDTGAVRDTSSNLDEAGGGVDAFETNPFALADSDDLLPGDLLVDGAVLRFDVDTDDPSIRGYLEQGLDDGILGFVVSTLALAAGPSGGDYPVFVTQQSAGLVAELTIDVATFPAGCLDADESGVVDQADLPVIAADFMLAPGERTLCDVNDDAIIDYSDLIPVLNRFDQ